VGDDEIGDGIEEEEMYNGNRKNSVLPSLSKSYSKLNTILVSASRHSSCPTLHCLLTVRATGWKSKALQISRKS